MQVDQIIASSLDARDHATACLAILSHPASRRLSRKTIERLWEFGAHGVEPEPVDVAMIEVLGDLMRIEVPA